MQSQSEELLNSKGNEYFALKQYSKALFYYDKVISINSKCFQAHFNKGVCLQSLKLYEQAIDTYDIAIEFKPTYHLRYIYIK